MKVLSCVFVCAFACTSAVAPVALAGQGSGTRAARRAPIIDFDGDGLADLAFPATDEPADYAEGEAREAIAVYLGRDRGKLSRLVPIATRSTHTSRAVAGYGERIGAVGDLDGDGRTELAVLWDEPEGQSLRLYHGTADGISGTSYQSLALPKVDDAQWYNLAPRAAGDVDGDGNPDVVIGYGVFRGIGGGKLAAPELIGSSATLVPVGDVDGDGSCDLVESSWDGTSTWLVHGGKRLAAPIALKVGRFAAAVDVDGDGVREVIGIDGSRVVTYRWTRGALVKDASAELSRGGGVWQVVGLGADLAVVASTSTKEIICNTRCFGPADFVLSTVRGATETAHQDTSDNVHLLAPGDIDGDGTPDLGFETYGQVVVRLSGGGETRIARELSTSPRHVEMELSHAALDP